MFTIISKWREIKRLESKRRELNLAYRAQAIRTDAYAPECLPFAEALTAVDARILELKSSFREGKLKRGEIKNLEKEAHRLHLIILGTDNGSIECVSASRKLAEVRKKLQELKGGKNGNFEH